ncbi:MAG: EAL domain-containing protein [Planctomycetota bacterium]|nr:EAL domain-containing protein [Planctomycetota bacterium]
MLIAFVMGGGVLLLTLSVVLLAGNSRAERESGTTSSDYLHIEGLVQNSHELLAMLDILTTETSSAFVLVERLSQRCREDIHFIVASSMFDRTHDIADLESLMDDALDRAATVQTADDPDLALEQYDEAAIAYLDQLDELQTQCQFIAKRDALQVGNQRRLTTITLIVAAVMYFIMVIAIFRGMLKRLVIPVQQLAGASERSMRLDEPFRLEPTGPQEVHALTVTVGAFVASLESKVAARTAELAEAHDTAVEALIREKVVTGELEQAMEQLEVFASTDKLTGLSNRAVFLDRLTQLMKHARRDGSRFAVLFFDFDRFKVVNDSLGHEVGDALLCDIATIFKRELRESDTVARFGGDEFVVLLRNLTNWSDAVLKAQRLLDVLARPHQLGDHLIVSSASIGVVTNERDYSQPGEMIRDADAAMYQAKENGRAQVVVFDQEMHADALDRLSLESDLRKALNDEQLRLVYQPIVDLETGLVSGFESLLRWDHPERGLISPLDFIPIAEDTGLIVPIGQWVLKAAAAQIAIWNRSRDPKRRLKISVNVSKRQLQEASFPDDVIACQREYGLQAGVLQLEITESMIVDDRSNVAPQLRRLRELGFPIVMDDFGTGVSSLSTLHEFPIDVLKIDQAFIRVLDRDRSLLAVVASITNLADNLGIQTVAEGIETADILGALQSIGCTWGQGYFFAKPMPPADVEAYLFQHDQEQTQRAA